MGVKREMRRKRRGEERKTVKEEGKGKDRMRECIIRGERGR